MVPARKWVTTLLGSSLRSFCNPSYFFFFQCKALEASNLTNSPKSAPKLSFLLWVQLITAVQQHRLGGGLTGKVYWLFGFRTSHEFSNYRQNPYESLCEVRNAFVARSCRKYQASLCAYRTSITFWTGFLAVGALYFGIEPNTIAELILHNATGQRRCNPVLFR